MLKRSFILIYGVLCYAIFLFTFLYAIGFVGNIVVPRSIDSPPVGSRAPSLLIDLGLLTLFALQHSGMARPAFKRWITRIVPEAVERSTYVLAASIALLILFVFWQPLGGQIWSVQRTWAVILLNSICFCGWLLVLVSTFLINHFDLFGLRQVVAFFKATECSAVEFSARGPYRLVRHPLYVGFIVAFWATPTMTATHLLFALITTLYILVGIRLEERDLVDALGEPYRQYRRRIPMLIPFVRRRPSA